MCTLLSTIPTNSQGNVAEQQQLNKMLKTKPKQITTNKIQKNLDKKKIANKFKKGPFYK